MKVIRPNPKAAQQGTIFVSDRDYPGLRHFKWRILVDGHGDGNLRYATTHVRRDGGGFRTVLMHVMILGAKEGLRIDHKNSNGLDNRRSNLRRATLEQNKQNGIKRKQGTSRFKGVFGRPRVSGMAYYAYITVNHKRLHLGTFNTETDAARTYNAAARKYFGKFANLNKIEGDSK